MINLQDYRRDLKRLEKAEALFDARPNDPKFPVWVREYNLIMESVLEYEYYHKIGWARFLGGASNVA